MNQTPESRVDVLIIGAGFAGLCMAIKLRLQGKYSFLVVDREAEVGGTWQVNTYPGCACDVQSHLYSYSFEPNPDWSRMFSPQPEIWNYLRHCAKKYSLYDSIWLNTELSHTRLDESSGLWQAETADGRRIQARFVVAAIGGLSVPSLPDIPGRDAFAGPQFHSQAWDHDVNLQDRSVAVIGTGASAIQFVPELQPRVRKLTLFQRTPTWVMPKPDRKVTVTERHWFRRVPWLQRLVRRIIYWHLESRVFAFVLLPRLMRFAEPVARWQIRRAIKDPVLRKKLTPDWRLGCKRVLISNNYYPALAHDNVELVTEGIAQIDATGVVTADGKHHTVDAIVYGTGFKATDPISRGAIIGRGGMDMLDAWAGGMQAYKGTTVHGFPNFFMLNGPNTGLGHSSVVFTIESQVAYIQDALQRMETENWQQVEVRADAQEHYNRWLQARMAKTIWSTGGCKSWYSDKNGRNVALWPGFTFGFRWRLRQFDADQYECRTA